MIKTKDTFVHFEIDGQKYEVQVILTISHEPKEGADLDGNRGVPADFIEKVKVVGIYNLTTKMDIPLNQETPEMYKAINDAVAVLEI